MKIIKYGPGWKPQTLTCSSCKSELEYTDADIKVSYSSDYTCHTIGSKSYVICPVCGLHNILKEVDYYD
jgi:hypothetical protein